MKRPQRSGGEHDEYIDWLEAKLDDTARVPGRSITWAHGAWTEWHPLEHLAARKPTSAEVRLTLDSPGFSLRLRAVLQSHTEEELRKLGDDLENAKGIDQTLELQMRVAAR